MAVTKLLLAALAVVIFSSVQANPVQPEELDIEAISRQFQEQAQRQFEEFKRRAKAGLPPADFPAPSGFPGPDFDVKNLHKDPNGHVFGESKTAYHVSSNVNGKKQEESGGHTIINDDGKITEYDNAK